MSEIRLPPQSMEAERCVLGCQLMGGSVVDEVRKIISESDFHAEVHGKVQKAIFAVADRNNSDVDAMLVAAELQAKGQLEDVGGVAFIAELLAATYFKEHAAHYASIVLDCSRRRKAIEIGKHLVEKSHDMGCELKEIAEAANDAAQKISESLSLKNTRPRPLSEHVAELFEARKSGRVATFYWGIPAIDNMIGGCSPGEMVVIGARPSCGKSLVALQWLDEAAAKGIPGLMISEEMSAESLAGRAMATITCIPSDQWRVQESRVSFDIRDHYEQRAPVLIAEKCSTIAAAERAIARAVQSHGVRIVAVDYAQLIKGTGDTQEQQIADVSNRMKAAAMTHDLVMILLAQLNRGIQGRENPSPQLSDLRGSGALEQDADVALFPFWPMKADIEGARPDEYLIYCRKNRNRGIGSAVIEMKIDPVRQRIFPAYENDDWENPQ